MLPCRVKLNSQTPRAILFLAIAGLVNAATIRVPADKPTIQAAILSSSSGDTILVSPGTYAERIDFSGKNVSLKSALGPDVTVIDGGQGGSVVSFRQGETSAAVIQGFTIQNGKSDEGGGVLVSGTSPGIIGNRIINNTGCTGGGIGVIFARPLIQGNTISGNSAKCSLGGGGIGARGDSPAQILNNVITNNTAGDGGGIQWWAGGAATIRDNVITGNTATGTGGAIATVNSAPAVIVGNLIAGNKATNAAALSFSNPVASLINNTIVNNQATGTTNTYSVISASLRTVGNLIIAFPGQTSVFCSGALTNTFRNNDVYSVGGTAYAPGCVDQTSANGNISADPKFINADGNYRLQATSPAIGTGDASAAELTSTDLDGNARLRAGKVDMGAYQYPGPTTATFSSSSLTFAQQPIGSGSSVQAITITNSGTIPLQFASFAITGDFTQTNTCPTGAGLSPGGSCVVGVTFIPTARGARTGVLTVTANTATSPFNIALSGTAIGSVLSFPSATFTFPNQLVNTDSAPLQIPVTNNGDAPFTVSSAVTTPEFSQTNNCVSVAPQASCAFQIVFRPIASGTRTGTVTIAGNAVGSPHTLNFLGNGQAPLPAVSAISPSTFNAGGQGFTLTVQGSNFISNSVVRWNGQDRATTFGNSGQLTAAIPASDIANGGIAAVTVFSAPPGGGASNAVVATIANLTPSLLSISPNSALAGGVSFQLTVAGTNFVASSTIRWNGNDRVTTFISPNQLRATITAADISLSSSNQITVFNPSPGGGTSNSATFLTVVPTPVPVLTSISPNAATAGDPGFVLTLTGSGFAPTSSVLWNRVVRPTTYISDAQLQATIPASDLFYGGTMTVSVFNPTPGGGNSVQLPFIIAGNPLPAISTVTPSTVTGGGPAFTLTVNGAGFSPASVVRWNQLDRPTTYVNAGQLTAAISAGDIATLGTGKITVFNPPPGGGTSVTTYPITIGANPAPAISSLTPASLSVGTQPQALQISGNGFTPASVVRWNGQERVTTYVDSSNLRVQVTTADLAAPGLAEIRVFNAPLGGGTSAPTYFRVSVGITANSLLYDKVRKVLWASVPSSQSRLGNNVVSINPVTGELGAGIFVGSEPGKMAMSDDGQYLYVALNGASAVRRVDLNTQQADIQFAVGSDGFFGAMRAEDMAVMPGNSHAVAISRMYNGVSPRHAGVAIFDDGVMRKNTTQVHTGSNRIEFSTDPTRLYGFNNETTEFGYRLISVDADGLKEVKVYGSSAIGGFGSDMKLEGGRMYATSGAILDPESGNKLGSFAFQNGSALGLAPDSALGRSFFLVSQFSSSSASLVAYDNSTFNLLGTVNLPGLTLSTGDDVLVRWGSDGLAFRTNNQVVIFRSAAVMPPSFSVSSVVSAASYAAGGQAPGSIVALFGNNLTPLEGGATATPLPATLGGVAVFLNGIAAPAFFAGAGQINFQIPWELEAKTEAEFSVGATGFSEKIAKLPLAKYSPGIFTVGSPSGQAIAVVAGTATIAAPQDSLPGARPVAKGEFLSIYATGLGPVSNTPPSGSVGPSDPLASTVTTPIVTLGGQGARVIFSGLAPGLVGVYQINVQVPDAAQSGGAVPLSLSIGGVSSNTPTIAVR